MEIIIVFSFSGWEKPYFIFLGTEHVAELTIKMNELKKNKATWSGSHLDQPYNIAFRELIHYLFAICHSCSYKKMTQVIKLASRVYACDI